ncbi:MAG: glycosyltransferase, partial [Candidatus Glassbacteria bacterium]|nr:glycosyltransferase [Candidatus Glassbacteria bacterium]
MFEHGILLATNTLGKWGETNGVEYTYRNLLKEFNRARIQVDAITYGPRDNVERFGSVTVITHKPRLPLKIDPALRVDLCLGATAFARRITSRRYSLVHSATPDPLGDLAVKAAGRSECPVVSVYHTVLDYYARVRVGRVLGRAAGRAAGRLMMSVLKKHYNKSALILAPSEHTRQEISAYFSPPVEVLSRGIDTEVFSPRFRDRDRSNGRVEVLYVGRVAPEKNLDLLVEVFSRRPGIDLKVVGDGPYLDLMKRKLPRAVYTGKLTGESLSRAFANSDLFVFPSRSDSFGNVVMQAMCSGIPAVVTDSMGPKEQVKQGVTGFIATDTEEFIRAV